MFQLDCPSTIEPMNAGLFVSPGYGTHDTRILDSYELLFVTSGHLGMFEDANEYVIQKNQTLILCPGKRHGGLFPYPADVNFYWIHFRTRRVSGSRALLHVPKVTTAPDPEYMTELFCQFISDQEAALADPMSAGQSRDIGFAHLIVLMLCEIGSESPSGMGVHRGCGVTRGQRIVADRARKYIDENYRKQISTLEVARDLGYGTDYVERAFHRVQQFSIVEAIHEKRIDEARALLRGEGRKNISEIAFACGFRDPSYFRRIFKQLTGLAPRQFRSLYSRTHINAH